MLGSGVGLVLFGDKHDAATMKAPLSLLTFGIEDPTTATDWFEAAGIPPGKYDVIVAA